MHVQENTLFDLGVKVTIKIGQYPLHHVTYAPAKIEVATSNEVAMSNSLGEVTITRMLTVRLFLVFTAF